MEAEVDAIRARLKAARLEREKLTKAQAQHAAKSRQAAKQARVEVLAAEIRHELDAGGGPLLNHLTGGYHAKS